MFIDGRAFFHQRIDIGNGHLNPDLALVQRLDHSQLVQVTRIVVVDRAPQPSGEVPDSLVRLGSRAFERGDLSLYSV